MRWLRDKALELRAAYVGGPAASTIEGPIYRPGTGRRTSLAGLSLRSPR